MKQRTACEPSNRLLPSRTLPRRVHTYADMGAGERIAFEVDGPHHFTANTLAVTGEMLARQKLLRARGWHVISVPFFHWAGRSDEARAQWLLQVRPSLASPSERSCTVARL